MCARGVPIADSRAQSSRTPPAPGLVFAFELRVTVGAPVEIGQVPRGRRRIVSILGGTFEGPGIKGKVVPGGADWQIIRADGFSELDTRYTLETDKGQIDLRAERRHASRRAGGDGEAAQGRSRSIRSWSTSGRFPPLRRRRLICSG